MKKGFVVMVGVIMVLSLSWISAIDLTIQSPNNVAMIYGLNEPAIFNLKVAFSKLPCKSPTGKPEPE